MRTKNDGSQLDVEFVRRAAQLSIEASSTGNGILALVHATKAIQILEFLHERYGIDEISSRTRVDTAELLSVICRQRNQIQSDVMDTNPHLAIEHPLTSHAGMHDVSSDENNSEKDPSDAADDAENVEDEEATRRKEKKKKEKRQRKTEI
jgi:hypothetical protein